MSSIHDAKINNNIESLKTQQYYLIPKVRLTASIDTSDSDQRLDVYIIQAILRLLKRCLNTSSKNVMYGYKVLGMFFLFHSILYLCIMNMLEQLARIVLPKEILDNFDIVKIETDESDIDSMSMTIYLDERMNAYLQKSEDYESKGFMDAVRITDFPIRDHKVILVLRRRRWKNKETGETFVDRISVTESGTRYSKEFAAFLKETYGHIPDDLPYA